MSNIFSISGSQGKILFGGALFAWKLPLENKKGIYHIRYAGDRILILAKFVKKTSMKFSAIPTDGRYYNANSWSHSNESLYWRWKYWFRIRKSFFNYFENLKMRKNVFFRPGKEIDYSPTRVVSGSARAQDRQKEIFRIQRLIFQPRCRKGFVNFFRLSNFLENILQPTRRKMSRTSNLHLQL